MVTVGVVREWNNDLGWGVVDSEATPGGCWVHFSMIDVRGYRSLRSGQKVEFTFEEADQDGFDYRGIDVRAVDAR